VVRICLTLVTKARILVIQQALGRSAANFLKVDTTIFADTYTHLFLTRPCRISVPRAFLEHRLESNLRQTSTFEPFVRAFSQSHRINIRSNLRSVAKCFVVPCVLRYTSKAETIRRTLVFDLACSSWRLGWFCIQTQYYNVFEFSIQVGSWSRHRS
jgi:hypothetical protein